MFRTSHVRYPVNAITPPFPMVMRRNNTGLHTEHNSVLAMLDACNLFNGHSNHSQSWDVIRVLSETGGRKVAALPTSKKCCKQRDCNRHIACRYRKITYIYIFILESGYIFKIINKIFQRQKRGSATIGHISRNYSATIA